MELGRREDGSIIGVPPSELPVPPAGARVFTGVQGRDVITVRATYLPKAQRQTLLTLLPNREDYIQIMPSFDINARIRFDESPARIETAPRSSMATSQSYDRTQLAGLLQRQQENRSQRLETLLDEPLFVLACQEEYRRIGSIKGVTVELWGADGYSGTKDRIVKAALDIPLQAGDDSLLRHMLAA